MRQIVIADTNEDGTLSREAFLFTSAEGTEALAAPAAECEPLNMHCDMKKGISSLNYPESIRGLGWVARRPPNEDGYRAYDGPDANCTYYCPKDGGRWTPIEEAPVEIRLRAGRLRNTLEAVGAL